ncbi:NAD-dependent epimerase/dehydratase family protein [Kushneria konosiri]|uniref:Protein CapI n=1 Tax=Kushneria konosiri TaxID=698828 RepID=A0A2Z2HHX1_9GAMM|nr:NAD-dependent epimerase/dehydratase family protein [Kushneria konosiri]ARS52931.1 protein CapI [Kushneria konosiri]
MNRKVLVTGAAGFIGAWLTKRLTEDGVTTVGVDNFSDYYSVDYKRARLEALDIRDCRLLDVSDRDAVDALFRREGFTHVVHLAAQAGVRYSVTHPHVYGQSNLTGFLNVLEACRQHGIQHLYYASSSSVYGHSSREVFNERDPVDHPVSLYAATKRANELMADSYASLYGMSLTGLRFFTVYGPWGRPDMAPMLFAGSIMNHQPLQIFNHGQMARDFTWVGDIIESVVRLINVHGESGETGRHQVFNIGRGEPTALMDFITWLEEALGQQAPREWLPMQEGDVTRTWADTSKLEAVIDYRPTMPLATGVQHLAQWCLDHQQWLPVRQVVPMTKTA